MKTNRTIAKPWALLSLCLGVSGGYAWGEAQPGNSHPGNGTGERYIPVPVVERGQMENGVNGIGADGKTPLMLAVESGDLEVIYYLLERGADTTLRNKAGESAFSLAQRTKSKRSEEILRQHLALHPPASVFYAKKHAQIAVIGGQNQVGAPRCILFHPLSVLVTDNGKPLANAPVRFSVPAGKGKFLTSYNSPASDWLLLRTDSEGVCRVYFALPNGAGSQRKAIAEIGAGAKPATFLLTTDPSKKDNSPFSASNVQANVNSDMSVDVSWVNHSDPDDISPILITAPGPNGKSLPFATAPDGSTSLHVPGN